MPPKKQPPKNDKRDQNAIIKRQVRQLHIDLKRGLLPYCIIFFLKIRPHYSLEIQRKMSHIAEGLFKIQQNIVYQNLKKLEQKGAVESYLEKSTVGAKRKYYYLTELGERLFEDVVIAMLYPTTFMFSTIMEDRVEEFGIKRIVSRQELRRIKKLIFEVIDK